MVRRRLVLCSSISLIKGSTEWREVSRASDGIIFGAYKKRRVSDSGYKVLWLLACIGEIRRGLCYKYRG